MMMYYLLINCFVCNYLLPLHSKYFFIELFFLIYDFEYQIFIVGNDV